MNSFVIVKNLIKRLFHEINVLAFIFIFPIFAGFFVFFVFGKTTAVKIGVVNMPQDDTGIVSFLDQSDKYDVLILDNNIENSLENKEVKAVIKFPDNFDGNSKEKIEITAENGESEVFEIQKEIEEYFNSNGNVIINDDSEDKYLTTATAVGMLTMFVIMFTGTGMGLLMEDKKNKTFMRIYCSPTKSYEVVAGQLLGNLILGVIQISVFLFTSTVIFKMDWGTSVLNIFIILFVFLIAAIGLAIGLVFFNMEYQKYMLVLNLVAIITSFLSGAFVPAKLFSDNLQKVAKFMPQNWVIEAYYKLTEGNTLLDVGYNIIVLLLFGLVLFLLGVSTLKPAGEDL